MSIAFVVDHAQRFVWEQYSQLTTNTVGMRSQFVLHNSSLFNLNFKGQRNDFLLTKCTSRLLLFGAYNFWITYPLNFSSVLWWRKLRFKFISTLHTQAQRIERVKVKVEKNFHRKQKLLHEIRLPCTISASSARNNRWLIACTQSVNSAQSFKKELMPFV